jgi:hypothetical protein
VTPTSSPAAVAVDVAPLVLGRDDVAAYARPAGSSLLPVGHFQHQRAPAYRALPTEVDDSLVVPRVQGTVGTSTPRVAPPALVVYDDRPGGRTATRTFAFTAARRWLWSAPYRKAAISHLPILADRPGSPVQGQSAVWLKPRIERPAPLPWDLSYVIRANYLPGTTDSTSPTSSAAA